MIKSKFSVILLLFSCLVWSNAVWATSHQLFNQLSSKNIAHFLGWVSTVKANNLCNGYYREPEIVLKYPAPANIETTKVHITATKPTVFSAEGDSVLSGHVTITQPGREIVADKIILHRDKKSNKVTNADLIGHVHFREHGKLLVGNYAHINFIHKTIVINNSIYRLSTRSPTGTVNVWGRAKRIVRDRSHTLTLYNGSYSACQPDCHTWQIKGEKLQLNKKSGRGKIYNAVLFFHGVPAFYVPYYTFSIDKHRKTGFLYPTISYTSKSGANIAWPFYFNLAPNYDATITPRIISRRGLLMNGLFRYLTASSGGQLRGAYIYHDFLFDQFKRDAKRQYVASKTLSRLENSNNNRGMVAFNDNTVFNKHWSGALNLNYVSDDYFYRDFGNVPAVINNNQLLNRVDLNYANTHWRFFGRLQTFQTLHLITQSLSADQYRRLPQLNLSADYPNERYGLDYHLDDEFVYFDHARNYITDAPVVTGGRLNIQPSITRPINLPGGYLQPNIQLPITFYDLQNQTPNTAHSITRVLPIVDVDGGLIFERAIHFLGGSYEQTLEPRVFYLYVPYHGQNSVPAFDTDISAFSYDSLFRINRFSGIDRIGDANQFTFALTSRFLSSETGEEKLRASIGQVFALRYHHLQLNNQPNLDPLVKHKISPIIGELQYYLNSHWNMTGTGAWDFSDHRVNNAGVNFQYRRDVNSMVNVSYNYLLSGDSFDNRTVNLSRFDFSFAWPLNKNWRVLGDWNYNISSHNPQAYFYGVEYDSCCWAFRLVNSRVFTGYDPNQRSIFDHRFYIQFMLKGLGNIGTNGLSAFLSSRISGFNDKFNGGAL